MVWGCAEILPTTENTWSIKLHDQEKHYAWYFFFVREQKIIKKKGCRRVLGNCNNSSYRYSVSHCKRNLKQLSFPRDVYYLYKPLRRNRWILPTGNCKPARADLVLLVLFPAFAPLPRPDILHEGSRKLKIVYANSSWRAFLYSCHAHTCNHRMTAHDWLNMVNAGLMRHGTWDI